MLRLWLGQGSTQELRELAAEGLGDLVRLTSSDALKPFVVQITGALAHGNCCLHASVVLSSALCSYRSPMQLLDSMAAASMTAAHWWMQGRSSACWVIDLHGRSRLPS